MIIKIAGVMLCTVILYAVIKNNRPEFAPAVEAVGVVAVFIAVFPELKELISAFGGLMSEQTVGKEYLVTLLKVLGISLVAQFAADMSRDAGQSALASKIEFAGRVLMLAVSLPLVKATVQLISALVENI